MSRRKRSAWLRFTVTVRNGSGSGEYKSGETVTITADRRSGYTFEKWTVNSGNVTLAKETDSTTTFTMPAENVTVTATYRYNGGSGSGSGAALASSSRTRTVRCSVRLIRIRAS